MTLAGAQPTPLWPRMSAAVLYGACSASMAFANKAVMSSYEFNFPFAIMTIQMAASMLALQALSLSSRFRGTDREPFCQLPPYTLDRARLFATASVCSALHSCLSLFALHGMNIPMYVALKRCTPAVNLVLACLVLRKPFPPRVIVFSVALITIGCLLAGLGDLSFEGIAYTVGGLSVLVQGLYQTYIQKAAEQNLSVLEIFQLNCYNCLPMFALGSIIMYEPMQIAHFRYSTDFGFIACLATVVVMGSVMNYALFLCTSLNSALTTSLIGVLKSVLQTIVGFFTFGGVEYDPVNVAGIVLNTLGGFFYTYAKVQEHNRSSRRDDQNEILKTEASDCDNILVHRSTKDQNVDKLKPGLYI